MPSKTDQSAGDIIYLCEEEIEKPYKSPFRLSNFLNHANERSGDFSYLQLLQYLDHSCPSHIR